MNGLLVWAQTDLSERAFSTLENNLYQIRKIASEELFANKDGFFTTIQSNKLHSYLMRLTCPLIFKSSLVEGSLKEMIYV
ncbi:MAG: hypothetical protein RL362_875 [Bacteroidota bacterium]